MSSSLYLVIRKKIPNNPYISSIKIQKIDIYFWKKMGDVNKNEAIL
jgi:hypothetical protein